MKWIVIVSIYLVGWLVAIVFTGKIANEDGKEYEWLHIALAALTWPFILICVFVMDIIAAFKDLKR